MKGIPRNTANAKHRDLRRNLAAPVSKNSKKVYLIFVEFCNRKEKIVQKKQSVYIYSCFRVLLLQCCELKRRQNNKRGMNE